MAGTAATPQAAAHGAQPARHLRSAATMLDGRRAHTIAFTDRHDQRHAHRRPELASVLALTNAHGPNK